MVIEADQVQNYWDNFESALMPLVDRLAPLEPFIQNCTINSKKPTGVIKRKINLRKKLLKNLKNNPTNSLRDRIKNLNVEIKKHFIFKKSCSV